MLIDKNHRNYRTAQQKPFRAPAMIVFSAIATILTPLFMTRFSWLTILFSVMLTVQSVTHTGIHSILAMIGN